MSEIASALMSISPLHPIWLAAGAVALTACASIIHGGCNRRAIELARVLLKR